VFEPVFGKYVDIRNLCQNQCKLQRPEMVGSVYP